MSQLIFLLLDHISLEFKPKQIYSNVVKMGYLTKLSFVYHESIPCTCIMEERFLWACTANQVSTSFTESHLMFPFCAIAQYRMQRLLEAITSQCNWMNSGMINPG